jgi:hypothetical protein
MKHIDHVVFTTEGVMKCERCGETLSVEFPIGVGSFESIAKAFIEVHKNCKEQTA